MQALLIDQKNLSDCQWTSQIEAQLQQGQVRFALETFALSANNITYADLGEKMAYWQFFPTAAGYGLLPIWGFARVVESTLAELPVGSLAYGYWPLAERWVLTPRMLSGAFFFDQATHRAALPAVYQRYQLIERARQPIDQKIQIKARYALLRPLYLTSWLCADFLRDANFFGAESVWILSASSKTALALGDALARLSPQIKTIGFSSPANIAFVERTACYGAVSRYDAIDQQSRSPTVVVDMAGNPTLLQNVYRHMGEQLRHTAIVGISHRTQTINGPNEVPAPLPGVKPQFFFAPTQAKKRSEQYGGAWIEQQSNTDWEAFLLKTEQWLQIHMQSGLVAARSAYLELLAGQVRPDQGLGFTL
jgi:hypothetical protein